MGVYSSPEIKGFTLIFNCDEASDVEHLRHSAERLLARIEDVKKSERRVKTVTIDVQFHGP